MMYCADIAVRSSLYDCSRDRKAIRYLQSCKSLLRHESSRFGDILPSVVSRTSDRAHAQLDKYLVNNQLVEVHLIMPQSPRPPVSLLVW